MFVPPLLPLRAVRLYSADGHSWEFPSVEAFVEAYGLSWISASVGPAFRVRDPELFDRTYPYVLRDDQDRVFTLEDCSRAWRMSPARRRALAKRWGRYTWSGKGPVPGTGKISAGSHYFRAPKTHGTHRAAAAALTAEGEPLLRAARRRRYLPSAHDDRQIAAREDRSWKRYRRTRWKKSRAS